MKIFYFTGTGNGYYLAKQIAESIECDYVRITENNYQNLIGDEKEICIIYPLYYWGVPKMIYKFLTNNNFNNLKYISFIENRGGSLNGYAVKQVKKILPNIDINYYNAVKLPSNYTRMYNTKSVEKNIDCLDKANNQIKKIIDDIKNRKKYSIKPHLLTTIFHFILYKNWFNSLTKIDEKFVVEDNCTNCGICAKLCPTNNITITDKPNWNNNCEDCMACISYCPTYQISINNKSKKNRYSQPYIKLKELFNK